MDVVIQLSHELRETALTVLSPLPFLLLLVYAVETANNPVLRHLFFYHLLAFAFIALKRMVGRLHLSLKRSWEAADPSGDQPVAEPIHVQALDLAKRWFSDKGEDEHDPIQEREVNSVLPGLVYGVLNSLTSICLYLLSGGFLSLLAELGELQDTVAAFESFLQGPEGTFLTALYDVTAIQILFETVFSDLGTTDAIFLTLLLIVPGYFAVLAARQLTYASEQVHVLFLKRVYSEASVLRKYEATGVTFLFTVYVTLLLL